LEILVVQKRRGQKDYAISQKMNSVRNKRILRFYGKNAMGLFFGAEEVTD